MMYRKPTVKIMDRHTLIELDGDFTDYEIGHLLNKAYLNHKAPHEYDELKKYIRDLVVGKHNSVYIMANGNPEPLASASILASPYISKYSGPVYYDYIFSGVSNTGTWVTWCYTNNATNCNSAVSGGGCVPLGWYPISITYNNGQAWQWGLLYTAHPIGGGVPGLYITKSPIIGSWGSVFTVISAKYGYAPYISSTNPLTLSTYFYWSTGNSSYSYSNVYFNITINPNDVTNTGGGDFLIPIFDSTGQYNFNSSTYYISMWQFTYT